MWEGYKSFCSGGIYFIVYIVARFMGIMCLLGSIVILCAELLNRNLQIYVLKNLAYAFVLGVIVLAFSSFMRIALKEVEKESDIYILAIFATFAFNLFTSVATIISIAIAMNFNLLEYILTLR